MPISRCVKRSWAAAVWVFQWRFRSLFDTLQTVRARVIWPQRCSCLAATFSNLHPASVELMKHLIVCREYPPAPYPPGGIGTYVRHIARLLAEAGETVHVIAQRWEGAADTISESYGGRLIVHRASLCEPVPSVDCAATAESQLLRQLIDSDCPLRAFAWQTARIAEHLVNAEAIDVIEAPEWEAPLYYFQLRRAVGLGPRRTPPCLVHLHSPSELIARHNGWDPAMIDLQVLRKLEAYTVRAADMLVCPSRYLARGAERLFCLSAGEVQVIPYPLGDTPALKRAERVWARDRISYVGRLELRKGVVEWVDAAIEVARSHTTVEFEFIGSDTSLDGNPGPSVRAYLASRIPPSQRARFRFRDSQRQNGLLRILGESPAVVVPSRWENLPYTCIEAMGTGMPVLTSPHGGMVELVSDGACGWVAGDASPPALAAALRRFLDTPPAEREAMGSEAEKAVRRICDNNTVLQRHLELRARLAAAGPSRSLQVPGGAARKNRSSRRDGIGIVITCLEHPELLPDCVASVASQNRSARAAVVVVDERHRHTAAVVACAQWGGWKALYVLNTSLGEARRIGAEALLAATPGLQAIVFATSVTRLEPHCLSASESVFERNPVEILLSLADSDAAADGGLLEVKSNFMAVSLRACSAGSIDKIASGTLTYPGVLVSVCQAANGSGPQAPPASRRYSVMALAQHGCAGLGLAWFIAAPAAEKIRALARAAASPRRAARWLAWQVRGVARMPRAAKW